MDLATLWFVAIAVLWTGYFFLEGFDFGVGMLLPVLGRTDAERTTVISTIGGVWDANEVWLIVAGGATFAAFPLWYATMFSGFYVALLIILVALILRGVAFEFRGRREDRRWRANWERAIVAGSLVPAVLWGIAFADIVRGVPIDARHEYAGGPGDLVSWYSVLGGLATLTLFLLHGALFLRLRTFGEVRVRARQAARWIGPATVLVVAGFLAWTQVHRGGVVTVVTAAVAVAALIGAWALNRIGPAGAAFTLTGLAIVAATATLFIGLYPDVLPSTINPAYSLTVHNASSTHYTLTIMTWAAVIVLPIVLAYQAWTYWVFARRIGVAQRPPQRRPTPKRPAAARSGHR
ncbi:cytochrome d ubiquinol oxidase subunit II [Pseudonocardia acidicola]|uniref:Cytochrome d ubiquinol oxidase subunit II n=1 Tax=Pseudonocardia acidicola TaxID=2724939 RepID=A0ABX1SGA6_9PSEU|nr:cytochrome d ubiquinol oxidase subunit II [Pseudonocardia acidicola]NMH99289.1 cytochrome d ubiquinol oxidase subunit II [Pseudonocardia acidicola]